MTAIPTSARPVPRRRGVPRIALIEIGAMAGTLAASVLALAAGSINAHVVLGLAFAAIATVHVVRRIRTVRAIARKGWARMQVRTRRRMLINGVDAVGAVGLVLTGLLSWAGLGGGGLHGADAFILACVLGAHLVEHRAWLAKAVRWPARAGGRRREAARATA
jgi:hypothetical protein